MIYRIVYYIFSKKSNYMTKRQYSFLLLLTILLYLSYVIIKNEYNKYSFSRYIENQREIITELKDYIDVAESTIEYKKTTAYKTLVLKDQQWYKMRGENVINLTHENTYNKFRTQIPLRLQDEKTKEGQEHITSSMTNFQKWIYFLFNKDLR